MCILESNNVVPYIHVYIAGTTVLLHDFFPSIIYYVLLIRVMYFSSGLPMHNLTESKVVSTFGTLRSLVGAAGM